MPLQRGHQLFEGRRPLHAHEPFRRLSRLGNQLHISTSSLLRHGKHHGVLQVVAVYHRFPVAWLLPHQPRLRMARPRFSGDMIVTKPPAQPLKEMPELLQRDAPQLPVLDHDRRDLIPDWQRPPLWVERRELHHRRLVRGFERRARMTRSGSAVNARQPRRPRRRLPRGRGGRRPLNKFPGSVHDRGVQGLELALVALQELLLVHATWKLCPQHLVVAGLRDAGHLGDAGDVVQDAPHVDFVRCVGAGHVHVLQGDHGGARRDQRRTDPPQRRPKLKALLVLQRLVHLKDAPQALQDR
mmetsp:Transcript_120790/g.346979  ORF Transcript_120790/g.346979 Transcript_120790/m.346979 type:complete len:298 (+) Transcript_120790:1364-2257(+)